MLKQLKIFPDYLKKNSEKGLYLPLLHKNITARTTINNENKTEEIENTENDKIQYDMAEK